MLLVEAKIPSRSYWNYGKEERPLQRPTRYVFHGLTQEMKSREYIQDDLPPWIPATTQHTTSGASEKAELHMVRAVDTGVVNVKNSGTSTLFGLTNSV
jgi:hypothetical protein